MQNVVSLRSDRPRPQRATFDVPRSGARILFFTGVRYCRDGCGGDDGDEANQASRLEAGRGAHRAPAAGLAVDLTAH